MFDKMIVSGENGAESKGRGRYFIVTSGLVGLLFLSAVVLSIYAVNLDLGTDQFDLSMMLAPVAVAEPEPPKAEQPRDPARSPETDKPIRNANILRPDETPAALPSEISVTKPTSLSRPPGPFIIDPGAVEGGRGVPGGTVGTVGNTSSNPTSVNEPVAVAEKLPEPPPAMNPKPPTGPIPLGVVNGRATSLPKPPYPPAAIAVQAQGEVKVQVMIDETGRVVSASAISGHPLLRREAERAALNARFSPTTLSKIPVKVTGMIVYNFKRG